MPEKPKIIAEFLKCPVCGCTETLTQKATEDLKEAGRIPKEAFVSLEKVIVPLSDPRVALSVETLLVHYDICANCGMKYCTRADRGTGMVQVRQQRGPKPPQTPFSPS